MHHLSFLIQMRSKYTQLIYICIALILANQAISQPVYDRNANEKILRFAAENAFRLPRVCGSPASTNFGNYSFAKDKGAVVFDTCNNRLLVWSGATWLTFKDSALAITGGDTTVFSETTDSTGNIFKRIIVAGPNNKLTGYASLLYDSANGTLRIRRPPGYPIDNLNLWVEGLGYFEQIRSLNKTELYNRVILPSVAADSAYISADTTLIKPLGIRLSDSTVVRLPHWVSGGGSSFDSTNLSYRADTLAGKIASIPTVVSYGENATLDSTILLLSNGTRFAAKGSVGSGGGEANTASNLSGGGIGIFKTKSGVDLQFKRLKAGQNVSIADNNDSVTIDASKGAYYRWIEETRTLPTAVGNAVNIGTFALTYGTGAFDIWINVLDANFSVSKRYILVTSYQAYGWSKAMPYATTGPYFGLGDFDLEINNGGNVISFRLRRTAGTIAGTANITIIHQGKVTDVFTPSSTTATVSAPTTIAPFSLISNINGNVGIRTDAPNYQLQVNTNLSTVAPPSSTPPVFIFTQTNNGGSSPTATAPALTLFRSGVSGQAYGNWAEWRLGRWENNSTNARTQFELWLNENQNATANVLTIRGNGNAGFSQSAPHSLVHIGGSLATAIRSITGARTLDITDYSILANATSAAFNVTLPTAVGISGRIYIIKKTDSSANAVTVNTTSSQTIDGATTYSLATQYKYVQVQSDGTNWSIIGNN